MLSREYEALSWNLANDGPNRGPGERELLNARATIPWFGGAIESNRVRMGIKRRCIYNIHYINGCHRCHGPHRLHIPIVATDSYSIWLFC
jgi:hypothetical protein